MCGNGCNRPPQPKPLSPGRAAVPEIPREVFLTSATPCAESGSQDLMTIPLNQLEPGSLAAGKLAVFLDFDGTLVDIAERPDLVVLPSSVRETVEALHGLLGGAVAIVSGRPVAEIEAFFGPSRLPVAGVHGLERRGSDGMLISRSPDTSRLAGIRRQLDDLRSRHPELLVEDKGPAVALHYRARPDLMERCHSAMRAAADGVPGVVLVPGKMVIEARLGGADKASAIAAFLAEPAFGGRRVFFAGDDATDEDGFALVNGLDGLSVKVGAGETGARYRAGDRAELMDWLAALTSHLPGQGHTGR